MKYIYLINDKVFGSDTEKPKELITVGASENLFNALKHDYIERYERWKSSLTELYCDISELDKIVFHFPEPLIGYIDITSITEVKDFGQHEEGKWIEDLKVYFNGVEIESNEAIQFMNWVIKNEYFFNGKYWYKDFVKDKLTVEELYEIFKEKK
jgi:hypothetical protein